MSTSTTTVSRCARFLGGTLAAGAMLVGLASPAMAAEHAHMQRSPGQQVADLRATDDYLLLHTVWAESMLQPTIDILNGSSCQ